MQSDEGRYDSASVFEGNARRRGVMMIMVGSFEKFRDAGDARRRLRDRDERRAAGDRHRHKRGAAAAATTSTAPLQGRRDRDHNERDSDNDNDGNNPDDPYTRALLASDHSESDYVGYVSSSSSSSSSTTVAASSHNGTRRISQSSARSTHAQPQKRRRTLDARSDSSSILLDLHSDADTDTDDDDEGRRRRRRRGKDKNSLKPQAKPRPKQRLFRADDPIPLPDNFNPDTSDPFQPSDDDNDDSVPRLDTKNMAVTGNPNTAGRTVIPYTAARQDRVLAFDKVRKSINLDAAVTPRIPPPSSPSLTAGPSENGIPGLDFASQTARELDGWRRSRDLNFRRYGGSTTASPSRLDFGSTNASTSTSRPDNPNSHVRMDIDMDMDLDVDIDFVPETDQESTTESVPPSQPSLSSSLVGSRLPTMQLDIDIDMPSLPPPPPHVPRLSFFPEPARGSLPSPGPLSVTPSIIPSDEIPDSDLPDYEDVVAVEDELADYDEDDEDATNEEELARNKVEEQAKVKAEEEEITRRTNERNEEIRREREREWEMLRYVLSIYPL